MVEHLLEALLGPCCPPTPRRLAAGSSAGLRPHWYSAFYDRSGTTCPVPAKNASRSCARTHTANVNRAFLCVKTFSSESFRNNFHQNRHQPTERWQHWSKSTISILLLKKSLFFSCSNIRNLILDRHCDKKKMQPDKTISLVEEMSAGQFACRLHCIPADGAIIIISCELLRCGDGKSVP